MVKAATAERYVNSRPGMLGADVGRRIRQARLERGMSLADLGGEDLSRSFLSLVELGRSRISLRALAIVAERLELPVSYFLDDAPGLSHGAAELVLDRAEAALAQQEPETCLRTLEESELPEMLRPRALWLQGRALLDLGRARDAIAPLREGLALVERRDDPRMKTMIEYHLGVALYGADNYDEALVHLRSALDEAMKGTEDRGLMGKITVAIGHVLYVRNEIDSAIEHYTRARDLFGSVSDLNNLACVYSGLSLAYEKMNDMGNALRYSKLSLGAFEAKQNNRQAARELNNLAVRYAEMGDTEQALKCAQDAIQRASQVGAQDVEALAHSTLASIYFKRDDFAAAEAGARRADELAGGDTDLARIDAWIVLAKLANRAGDQDRADELFKRSLDTLKNLGHRKAYADAALDYSLILRQRGNTEGALEYALQAAQARPALSA